MKCPYDENGSDQEYHDLVQRISIHPACKNQRDSGEIKKNHQKGKHQQALPWFQYLFFFRRMRPFCRHLVSKGFVKIWGIIFIEVNRFSFVVPYSFLLCNVTVISSVLPAAGGFSFSSVPRDEAPSYPQLWSERDLPAQDPAGSREGAPPALFPAC